MSLLCDPYIDKHWDSRGKMNNEHQKIISQKGNKNGQWTYEKAQLSKNKKGNLKYIFSPIRLTKVRTDNIQG